MLICVLASTIPVNGRRHIFNQKSIMVFTRECNVFSIHLNSGGFSVRDLISSDNFTAILFPLYSPSVINSGGHLLNQWE